MWVLRFLNKAFGRRRRKWEWEGMYMYFGPAEGRTMVVGITSKVLEKIREFDTIPREEDENL